LHFSFWIKLDSSSSELEILKENKKPVKKLEGTSFSNKQAKE
jgi:hypothetical protein